MTTALYWMAGLATLFAIIEQPLVAVALVINMVILIGLGMLFSGPPRDGQDADKRPKG